MGRIDLIMCFLDHPFIYTVGTTHMGTLATASCSKSIYIRKT